LTNPALVVGQLCVRKYKVKCGNPNAKIIFNSAYTTFGLEKNVASKSVSSQKSSKSQMSNGYKI